MIDIRTFSGVVTGLQYPSDQLFDVESCHSYTKFAVIREESPFGFPWLIEPGT